MTVAAFHLGLMSQTKALTELLRLYQGGESPYTLRKRFNRRDALSQEEQSHLRELTTVVLLLAQKGLHERGFSEKRYLEPLFRRAAELTSPAKEMIQQLEKGADIHTVIEQYAKL